MSNVNLARLRDAVVGRGREVEVGPDGEIREVPTADPKPGQGEPPAEKREKPTRLAPRTFGS